MSTHQVNANKHAWKNKEVLGGVAQKGYFLGTKNVNPLCVIKTYSWNTSTRNYFAALSDITVILKIQDTEEKLKCNKMHEES